MLLFLCRPCVYGEFARGGAEGVVDFEGLLEEICSFCGDITGDGWPCRSRADLVNACKQPVGAILHTENGLP